MSWTKPIEKGLSQISFPAKFGSLFCLIFIPFVIFNAQILVERTHAVKHYQMEKAGLQVAVKLQAVMVSSLIQNQQSKVSSLIADLSALVKESEIKDAYLKDQITSLARQWQAVSAKQKLSVEEVAQYFEQISSIYRQVNRAYKLNTDTNIDNATMISSTTNDLPSMINHFVLVAKFTQQVIKTGKFTPNTYIALSNANTTLLANVEKLNEFQKVLTDQSFKSAFIRIDKAFNAYATTINDKVISPDEISLSAFELEQLNEKTLNILNKELLATMPHLNERIDKRLNGAEFEMFLTIATSAIAFIAVFYFLLGMYRQIKAVIENFSEASDALAAGDLTVRLPSQTKDELNRLVLGFNTIAEGFSSLVKDATATTKSVHDKSNGLKEGADITHDNMEAQIEGTQRVLSAIEQMTQSAESVEGKTTEAVESTNTANNLVATSQRNAQDVIDSTHTLMHEIEDATTKIKKLAKQTSKIEHMSEEIKSIADQTNLLALNAAIEAARAGEQGRGFAVVADEVRSLAQRTQNSTEEIQATIVELQSGTNEAVNVIQLSMEKVQENVQGVHQTAEALDGVKQVMDTINQLSTEIVGAVHVQREAATVLTYDADAIKEMAEKTNHSTKETINMSDDLLSVSGQLYQQIKQFKVE